MPISAAPIAAGRTAEIYAWGDGKIIKLIRADFPAYLADQEWRYARAARKAGLRAPKAFELLEVDGRRGVVFERLVGMNMVEVLRRSPMRMLSLARHLGQLHAELHTSTLPDLPSQHERIARRLQESPDLPGSLRPGLLGLLARLPAANTLCHGDFHPENLVLSERGPLIIDWESCMHGNPSGDVANTCLWIRSAFMFGPGLAGWLARQIGRRFERAYLDEYRRSSPGPLLALPEWMAIQAACRLSPYTRHEVSYLLALIAGVDLAVEEQA